MFLIISCCIAWHISTQLQMNGCNYTYSARQHAVRNVHCLLIKLFVFKTYRGIKWFCGLFYWISLSISCCGLLRSVGCCICAFNSGWKLCLLVYLSWSHVVGCERLGISGCQWCSGEKQLTAGNFSAFGK